MGGDVLVQMSVMAPSTQLELRQSSPGICFSNYTILPLYLPESPSKPCLTCSRQWCLDQHLAICKDAVLGDPNPDTATGKEGDVEARCFRVYTMFYISHSAGPGLPTSLCLFQHNTDTDATHEIERDSPRDQLVVTLFLLIVFGLLIGAAIKGRMAKVVDWNAGTRRWWEVRNIISHCETL
jgi:hypothetical protein